MKKVLSSSLPKKVDMKKDTSVPKICDEFFKYPNINPKTKRSITENGKVYKDLVKECGDPLQSKERSRDKKQSKKKSPSPKQSQDRSRDKKVSPKKSSPKNKICDEFFKNPIINPRTKRSITENGKVYKGHFTLKR